MQAFWQLQICTVPYSLLSSAFIHDWKRYALLFVYLKITFKIDWQKYVVCSFMTVVLEVLHAVKVMITSRTFNIKTFVNICIQAFWVVLSFFSDSLWPGFGFFIIDLWVLNIGILLLHLFFLTTQIVICLSSKVIGW